VVIFLAFRMFRNRGLPPRANPSRLVA